MCSCPPSGSAGYLGLATPSSLPFPMHAGTSRSGSQLSPRLCTCSVRRTCSTTHARRRDGFSGHWASRVPSGKSHALSRVMPRCMQHRSLGIWAATGRRRCQCTHGPVQGCRSFMRHTTHGWQRCFMTNASRGRPIGPVVFVRWRPRSGGSWIAIVACRL